MAWLIFFVMCLGNGAGALVAPYGKRNAVRGVLAIALSLCAVAAPRVLGRDWPIATTVFAFGTMAGCFRVLSILRYPSSTPGARLASVAFLVIDARHVPRCERSLRIDLFVTGAFEIALAVGLFIACDLLPPVAMYSGWPSALRTLVAGTSAYFLVEGVARVAEGLCAAHGVAIGALHAEPIQSRTVAEFWAKRWNLAIHALLNDNVFRPVAKHAGAATGVMAAFVASAVLHFVPIWVAYDARWACAMGAFFVIHGAIVIVEAKLGVVRWPRVLGHAWTLGWFAITLPLFVEPMLRSLGR